MATHRKLLLTCSQTGQVFQFETTTGALHAVSVPWPRLDNAFITWLDRSHRQPGKPFGEILVSQFINPQYPLSRVPTVAPPGRCVRETRTQRSWRRLGLSGEEKWRPLALANGPDGMGQPDPGIESPTSG